MRVRIADLDGEFLASAEDLANLELGSLPDELSFLPVLDPYLQGYRSRGRCLGPDQERFVFDAKGNATSVVLVAGRPAGVWELAAERAEVLVHFFVGLDRTTRRRVLDAGQRLAVALAGEGAAVAEVTEMTPLTERAGWVLSPLGAGRR